MKFLIALLIIIPTLIAILLFTVAALAYNNPAMLAAASNPALFTLCIVAGVRIICGFPSDIYTLEDAFLKQDDITLIEKKDYIAIRIIQ